MGGALRTLSGPIAAPRLNPAALGVVRGFFAGSSYATRREGAFDAVSFTIVDNVTSPMGGAIEYLHVQGDDDLDNLSLSLAAGKQGLWWGFTVRYARSREREDSGWQDDVTMDMGFLFERPSGLRLAAVGYNLADTTAEEVGRRVAFGASYPDILGWTLAADVVRTLDTGISRGLDFHLGGEYAFGNSGWTGRLGQMWLGETGKDYASAGLGWAWKSTFRLAYAVQIARQDTSEILQVFSAEGSF